MDMRGGGSSRQLNLDPIMSPERLDFGLEGLE